MVAPARVEGFTDGEGRTVVVARVAPSQAGEGAAAWHLLATRGPRTLAGVSAPERSGLLSALAGFGSFGIVEDDATRGALAAVAAFAGGSAEFGALAALSGAASLHCALGDLTIRRLRSLDDRCGRGRVDALARSHPHLMSVVGMVDERLRPDVAAALVEAAGRGDEALATALRASLALALRPDGADPLAAHLSGLAGLPLSGFPGPAALRVACGLPADWAPREAGSALAFGRAALVAEAVSEASGGVLSPAALLAHARGRWPGFLQAVAAAAGVHGGSILVHQPGAPPARARAEAEAAARALGAEAADMVAAFVAQCGAPCACRVEARGADEADLPYAAERLCLDLAHDPQGLVAGAWRLLLAGKGLVAVLRAAGEWHGRQAGIELALRGAADPRRWTVPFGPFRSGGLALVPLGSAAELAAEGAALRHCVGTYAGRCMAGESVIVSVRGPDGERLSTVELSLGPGGDGRGAAVVQHKGPCNAPPPPDELEAAAALRDAIDSGSVSVAASHRPGVRRRRLAARVGLAWDDEPDVEGDALRDVCGYDWRRPGLCEAALSAWSRFLPRDATRASPAAVTAALRLRGPLLDLPAARTVRRSPRPLARRFGRVLDFAVPVLGIGFLCVSLAEATRNLAGRASARPAAAMQVPALSGDPAIAWGLRSLALSGPGPCPAWAPAGEDVRCGSRGGIVVAVDGERVEAALTGPRPPVPLFRAWRDADGATRAEWPSGRDWEGWLAAALARPGGDAVP